MKKKIINGLLMMALAVSTTSSFVSCTDTNADDIAQIREQMADQSTIEGLKGQVAELMGLVQRLADVKIGDKNLIDDQKYLEELFKQLQELGVAANQGQSGNVGPQLPDGERAQNLNDWVIQVTNIIKTLQDKVRELEGKVCTCDLTQYTPIGDFQTLQTAFNTFMSTYQAVDPTVFASNSDFQELKNQFNNLNLSQYAKTSDLDNYAKATDLQALQTQLNNLDLSKFLTAEDLQDLEGKFNTLKNQFDNIDWSKYASADEFKTLKDAFNAIDFTKYATKDEIQTVKNDITSITTDLNTLKQIQATHTTQLQELNDSINKAYLRAMRDSARIDVLEAASASHATKQELKDSVDSLRKEILAVKQAAKEYTDQWIEALKTELTTKITDLETATNLKFGEMQNLINGLDERITKAEADVKDLAEKQAALQDQVDELTKKVEENSKKIESIFSAMKKQVTGIIVQGAYSPVFGIGMLPVDAKTNILAAYYGYATKKVEFPAKANANNYVDQEEFWLPEEGQFVKDIESYGANANQLLLSDADDNAGKLYLTVNPAQVDFTDKEIVLENSQGTAAPIELSRLRKSNYKLSFGWTRSAQNGFYEAKAKISAENLDAAKARIDVATLKEAAKDLYNKHNTASLKEAAQAIISQKGDILDAQAAKATYEGVDEKGNVEFKDILSDYSIATTVIRPLSYNTLRGWNPTSIPGLDRVESVINRFFNKINVKFDFGIKTVAQMPQIDLITIPELDKEYYINVHIKQPIELKNIPVSVPGQWVEVKVDKTLESSVHVEIPYTHLNYATPDPNDYTTETLKADVPYDVPIKFDEKVWVEGTTVYFSYTYNLDISQDVDITDIIKDLYGEVTQPIDGVNETLKSLQKFADEVNEMLKSIENLDARVNGQIEDMKNDIKNEIIGYMDRFEKKVLSYASYVNQALQPVLLYKSVNGLKRVSTIEKGASKMSGTVLLVPTSFNAELLSPAFKKLVVCTGAWKADGTFDANEAKRVNGAGFENFGKVFEGQERVASFEGKAGYKYRIVYQALDYHGMIASSRYYVQY